MVVKIYLNELDKHGNRTQVTTRRAESAKAFSSRFLIANASKGFLVVDKVDGYVDGGKIHTLVIPMRNIHHIDLVED